MPTSPQAKAQFFHPKLLTSLKDYTLRLFWGDLTAGIIVGIVALPLAIAFGIASGVSPDRGLTTAIVAGVIVSLLGGSRVQIGGPTGAFVIIVYRIVETYGLHGLILCTLLAGMILIAMGLLRLGAIIKFIPYPLTVGFTSGIAVVIFSSQIGDFLGLKTGVLPSDFVDKWAVYLKHLNTTHLTTALLSIFSMAIILLWPRINRRIPGSIIAILVISPLVYFLQLPVETIGSRFGAIATSLPTPSIPRFTLAEFRLLLGPAFTVALLGAIESLLSATVADGMTEGRHRSNTELIAQGIANIASAFFGGIPATGAIARTATNVKNGGRTPIAGILHALTLFLIVVLFGRWARLIPLCVLSSILIVVAYHMSEWRAFKTLLKAPRMDVAVLITTFLITVLIDLTVAVEVGLLMSIVLFIKRMTDVTSVREVTRELTASLEDDELSDSEDANHRTQLPTHTIVFEAEGAFFFGVTERLRDLLDIGRETPKVMILRMRHVLALDASGVQALRDLRKQCKRRKIHLIIEGIHAQPLIALERTGLLEEFGTDNVLGSLDESIERSRTVLGEAKSAP